MTLVWVLCGVLVLLTGSAVLVGRLFHRDRSGDTGIEWLRNFSIEDYRPMERLLRESDYEFLAAQPVSVLELRRAAEINPPPLQLACARLQCS